MLPTLDAMTLFAVKDELGGLGHRWVGPKHVLVLLIDALWVITRCYGGKLPGSDSCSVLRHLKDGYGAPDLAVTVASTGPLLLIDRLRYFSTPAKQCSLRLLFLQHTPRISLAIARVVSCKSSLLIGISIYFTNNSEKPESPFLLCAPRLTKPC